MNESTPITRDQDARKQTGTIILTFDKIDFKLTLIRKDKEGYFILTKDTANKDDTTILNSEHRITSTH